MAGFRGYNEEDFKVGIRPSQMWREIADIVRSDFKLVKCYDVPTFSDTSKKIEVKSIGTTKRNSIQEIGARGAEFTFRQMITDNYMNVCGDIIETSLGKIIKRVDGNGDFYSLRIESYGISIKDDVYNVAGVYSVGSNPFYIRFKKNGRTVLEASTTVVADSRDTATEIMTELLTALAADDANGYLTIVDNGDGTGTVAVNDEGASAFDSYECSDNLSVGCIINIAGGSDVTDLVGADFVNDKTIIPCVIIDTDTGTVLDMVYVTKKLSNTQVVAAGSVYKTAFNASNTDIYLKAIGFIDLDENESYTTDYMFVRSAEYLSGEENELRAAGAKCLSLINTLGSAKLEFPVQDKPMIEVMAKADSYEYTKPMNDDNVDATEEWKEATREGSILEPLATFPDSIAGSVVPTWTMEFGANGVSVAPNANDTHFGVYINGEEFKVAKGSHASIYLALEELEALINADADSRYTATASNGTVSEKAKIVVVANDNFKKLHCQGFVVVSTGSGTAVTSTETIASNADVYSEIAKTVKFSKFLIGTSFCNLRDFCEVGKLTVDITREIAEIPSVCGEQGRKGWDNSTYSIYVTVDTTDIQSVRVYDKWAKYIGNQNFILLAVDVDSGLGFLFPKCRFEEHIQQAMNNLQGHQYKINVNFDPEKKFVIVLPQNLTA